MSSNNLHSAIKQILDTTDKQEAYYRVVSAYMNGPEKMREEIRKGWDYGIEWIYPDPKRLACSINETHSPREKSLALLVYQSILDLREIDPRDALIMLAIVYHSCLIAQINPENLFSEVASVSSPQIACFFLNFLNRSEQDKSLEAFMLIVKKNADGENEIIQTWER